MEKNLDKELRDTLDLIEQLKEKTKKLKEDIAKMFPNWEKGEYTCTNKKNQKIF